MESIMSITFEQFDATLAAKGIKVIHKCTIDNALGHTDMRLPNEMHVCSSAKIPIRTHEGIHLLQFRYGLEKTGVLLSKCGQGEGWSDWKDTPDEYQAYQYQNNACATQVVLDNLDFVPAPVVKPEPSISVGAILLLSSLPLMIAGVAGVFWKVK